MKKKGIIIAIILLAIGFATVSTTLVLNSTVGVGADVDDYDIIFTSAKIGTVDQIIKKTNKTADTIEFDVLLNKVGEEKVLNYTVKNNSTQYEANANMKCYAINDTDEFMTKYITISGELAGKTITFAQVVGNSVLSDEINFKAQESKNGTITMSLKKSYAGEDEVSVTLKCEIITNADSSDEVKDKVVPVVIPTAGLYDANDNLLCEWDTCGIDVSKNYNSNDYQSDESHVTYVTNNDYPTAVKLVIDEDVLTMGSNAFQNSDKLVEIIIPGSIKNVPSYVFNGNQTITKVTLLEGVETIGTNAFYGCTNLSEVSLPQSLTEIGNNSFTNCTSLTSITLPKSITTMGYSSFSGCTGLEEVIIEPGSTVIGWYEFQGCTSLTSITIPGSVQSVGNYAFNGCTNLKDVVMEEGLLELGYGVFNMCDELTNVTIPGSLKTIEFNWFNRKKKLTSVTIGYGIETIKYNAFSGCTSLNNVTIPGSVKNIEMHAFSGCTSLTNLVIEDGVEEIGNNAFQSSAITSITIPGSVTLGTYTFSSCSNLREAIFESGIEEIPDSTFSGCTNLEEVTIPAGVTKIGYSAFESCTSINDLNIPNTVTIINEGAFNYVPHITYTGTAEGSPWGALAIN